LNPLYEATQESQILLLNASWIFRIHVSARVTSPLQVKYKNISSTCYGHCSKVEMYIFLQQYIWVHDTIISFLWTYPFI